MLTSEGSLPPRIAMEEFNRCLDGIDVVELASHGCLYTWSLNWKASEGSVKKLDYVFCNEEWLKVFVQSSAHFLPHGISDHAQVVVHLARNITSGPRPFKYIASGSFIKLIRLLLLVLGRNLRSELVRLSRAELEFMRSKARMTWLEKGDFGTKFFSRSVLAYKNKQQISMIRDDDGKMCTEPKEIEDTIVSFYQRLFSSKGALFEDQKQ
ncbi:hypothetical protein LIER_39423 [Lithospermum erythrorhizon]|uniref:Uncharacterized protein n=1 Tax=Lithospermum erythrorhizon TaxID=34254 RepID=A0AAV3QJY1_LITER